MNKNRFKDFLQVAMSTRPELFFRNEWLWGIEDLFNDGPIFVVHLGWLKALYLRR